MVSLEMHFTRLIFTCTLIPYDNKLGFNNYNEKL